jgi:hypothetical protein
VDVPYKYTYPLAEKLSKFSKIHIFHIIPNNYELYYNSLQLAGNSLKNPSDLLGNFCFTYNNSTHILSTNTNVDIFDTYNKSVKSLGVSTELDLSKESVDVSNIKGLLREQIMNWREKWILENPGWDKDKDLRVSPKYPTDPFYSPKNKQIMDLTDPNKIGYSTNVSAFMQSVFNIERIPSHLRTFTNCQNYCYWATYKYSSIVVNTTNRMVDGDIVEINYDSTFYFIDRYILNICNAVRDSLVSHYRSVHMYDNSSDILDNFPVSRVIVNGGNSKDSTILMNAFYRCDHANILPRSEEADISHNIYPFSDSYTEVLENSLKVDISSSEELVQTSLLDGYPTIKMLIQATKSHRNFTAEISIDIQDHLDSLSDESYVILIRLQGINDPFVQTTLYNYHRIYDEVIQAKEYYVMSYGGENYHSNFLKWRAVYVQLSFMLVLVSYMSPEELRFYQVAKESIMQLRFAHANLYRLKAIVSKMIAGLNHNELMAEVGRLLAKNPFGR